MAAPAEELGASPFSNLPTEVRGEVRSEIKKAVSTEVTRLYAEERRVAVDGRFRGGLAYLIIIALIGITAMGAWRRMPPGDLAQYLSPLTGLAGLAVGYYFGMRDRGAQGPRPR
jgi:hypothetical protein